MTKQIIVIHGGEAFQTYDAYIDSLKMKDVSMQRLKRIDWKGTLTTELGDGYEVINPQMPQKQNARYLEWRIWFERLIPLFDEQVIFIGHSLGGLFLAKFLSEQTYPKYIRATFLVAAPFNTSTDHPLVDFIFVNSLDGFIQQAGQIFLYHSRDDGMVPFSNCVTYQKVLPTAHVRVFEDRYHFNQETFPELVDDIRQLT